MLLIGSETQKNQTQKLQILETCSIFTLFYMTNNDLLSLNTLRKSLYVNKVIALEQDHIR